MQKMMNLNEIKETIQGSPSVLLLVKAGNCGVCESVQFKMSELLKSYLQVKGMYVFKEDVPEITAEYVVFSAPTLLLFVEGKEIYRVSRFVRFDELKHILQLYEEKLE
ncbi:thioredoxin family protein [Peribacillus asahii]|uniref:Thioredoxin n=1 Tax=Peribacillus asahii TaxID=228899 RepID=A0A3Q9RPW4_9BACI|nr:thioredoxin family protein [Peribacillus asahii]AZV43999.1 thioredoxin [Peribacillus asahii]USK83734.1 thioredoxin family protein [Peribacillus asahii]